MNAHTRSRLHTSPSRTGFRLRGLSQQNSTPPEQNLTAGAAQIEARVFRGELTDSLGDNTFLLLSFGHTKQ